MGYALFFNYRTRVADWVVERIDPFRLEGPADRRFSSFRLDPAIQRDNQASLVDYRGSGYDRGHMAPAADMKWDQDAMDQSFRLTNIAPQVGAGFNRGIWASLEEKVRSWASARGEIYVFTGPVYLDYEPRIGAVVVPDGFYKIVYDPARNEALAFLLPNIKIRGRGLAPYQTSIDDVETASGLDFLAALDDRIEVGIESTLPPIWN